MARKVHFTLQGKGGVGKSYVSSILVQHHHASGQPCVAIDTDPVNATLQGYKGFATRRIELMDGNTLVERRFDDLIEEIVKADQVGLDVFVLEGGLTGARLAPRSRDRLSRSGLTSAHGLLLLVR